MQAYAERFENYEKSPLNYMRAVAVKIVQKLTRPADAFLVQ